MAESGNELIVQVGHDQNALRQRLSAVLLRLQDFVESLEGVRGVLDGCDLLGFDAVRRLPVRAGPHGLEGILVRQRLLGRHELVGPSAALASRAMNPRSTRSRAGALTPAIEGAAPAAV